MSDEQNLDLTDVINNISSFLYLIEDYKKSFITEDDVILGLNILESSIKDFNKNENNYESAKKNPQQQTTSR